MVAHKKKMTIKCVK